MRRPSVFRRLSLHWSESTQVVRIAYPVILGMLSYSLLSFADTAMLGRLGPAPQATSGVAGVLFFAIVFTLAAIASESRP